ncbi:YCF48-related protein [Lunatimonas salinarum]|uniref:YCF48-related protein n=1 Tax=Lunatimonas salinarum TaxID=1774590 RepID=UPI001AE04EB8|nr:YCF48-related protein [Lunatimonas salinarum]
MKRIVFLGLLLLTTQAFSQSWRRVGSWGNDYSDIKWINNEVGYICGENIFLKSIDAGLSWAEFPAPSSEMVTAMDFFDEERGLVLAARGEVYITGNGGRSWQSKALPSQELLKKVLYMSATQAWIIGENGTLMQSSDGGQTWALRPTNASSDFNDIFFVDSLTGYIATSGSSVLKTTDGGATWQELGTEFEVSLHGIHFVSHEEGYAVGSLGTIIKTIDGAVTWQFINSGIDTDFTGVTFNRNNPLIGVIIGKSGTMLRTFNGGLSFVQVISRTVQDLNAIDFRQETNNVFAVANSGFLVSSTNSGASWSIRLSGRSSDFSAVQFTSDLRGYIVGAEGLVLLTGNGGNSFTDRSRNLSLGFKALHFVSAGAGYVSGENGNLISTTNSGANWTTLNPGTNRSINGIHFFNLDRGFVVGERGYIASTENRGINWVTINSGESVLNFNAITFFEESEGIIIGDAGFLARSANGTTWTRVTGSTNANLRAISVLDEQTALVVGDQGVILKTVNRGSTWARISSGYSADFTDVAFLDESVGFITGRSGLMIRTFDGGETWERLETGTFQDLTGLSFGDLNVGYAVGQNGLLFQYTCQVPVQPTAIFGENNICVSRQIYTIQQGEEPGTTYEWRVDGGSIVEGQGTNRIVVNWDIAGRNAVMVRGQNSCGNGPTSALEVVVSRQPDSAPPIQGDGVVCLGTISEFFVDSIPGTEYVWQVTGGIVRGGQGTSNIEVEWTTLGNHTVRVSTTNPCGQGPTSQKPLRVITVPNQPGQITGSTQVGFQEVDYEVPSVQDINYQWALTGGGTILSGQGTSRVRVKWEQDGDYSLTVTPFNACEDGASRTIEVNVNFITAIEETPHPAGFQIYPNPSTGDVRVRLGGISDVRELRIYNHLGQEILNRPLEGIRGELEVKDLPKGLLQVVLRGRTKEYTKTLWIR